jgi:formaldehyde-activating enzyme involved in methanogenesis
VSQGQALRAALEDARQIVGDVQTAVGNVKAVVDRIDLQVFDNQVDHDCGFFGLNC